MIRLREIAYIRTSKCLRAAPSQKQNTEIPYKLFTLVDVCTFMFSNILQRINLLLSVVDFISLIFIEIVIKKERFYSSPGEFVNLKEKVFIVFSFHFEIN